MAIVAVAMDCGNGTRFTDTSGGCNSLAYTVIGTNSNFLGPKFSIMFRLKLVNGSLTIEGGRVGTPRFFLRVVPGSTLFTVTGNISTTACGTIVDFTFTKTKDTSEHSLAWTYDQAGLSKAYWDGVEEYSAAASCSDISAPTSVTDRFSIEGATNYGGVEVFNIDRVLFAPAVAPASQILDIHQNCSSF